jgi:hypothetical protein
MAFNMKEGQSVWINGKLANFDGDDGAWRVLVPNCYNGEMTDCYVFEDDIAAAPAQPAGELRELVEKWRKQALAMVPPEYAERQMHGKYFRLDNEAAGIDACADELEDVLQKVKPASTEDTYNEGGGVA